MEQIVNTFKTLLQNYELGFISSSEFIFKYLEILELVGSGSELRRKMDVCLQPLANYLQGILKGSRNTIENFRIEENI